MNLKPLQTFCTVVAIGVALSACRDPREDVWRHIPGSGERQDFIVYLNKGTSNADLNKFAQTVLGIPRDDGRGSNPLPGLSDWGYVSSGGYEGYSMDFWPNATDEQRSSVKDRIAASPMVFTTFEYAIPNDIRLPGDREFKREGFPKLWFAPVNDPNKPDWEILPQEARAGEVILSKRNELGILSNFAATPFELDGKRYASVEGFWQAMLYPEGPDDPRAKDKSVVWKFTREQVAQMTAFDAKAAGTLAEENMAKLGIDWCTYQERRFPYRSATPGEHYKLILAAMRAKLDQNPEVKRILLATGDLKLRPDHIEEPNAPPEWHYYDIWMQLRTELQRSAR